MTDTDGEATDRDLTHLLTATRTNVALAWVLVGVFALVAVESLLTRDYLWAAFSALVATVVVLPPVAARQVRRMPPWEVVLLAGLPVVGRAVATLQVTRRSLIGRAFGLAVFRRGAPRGYRRHDTECRRSVRR